MVRHTAMVWIGTKLKDGIVRGGDGQYDDASGFGHNLDLLRPLEQALRNQYSIFFSIAFMAGLRAVVVLRLGKSAAGGERLSSVVDSCVTRVPSADRLPKTPRRYWVALGHWLLTAYA